MSVLITGGTGFIGSHTVVELLENNEDLVIVDNLSNSDIKVLDKIKQITGKEPRFYELDILDENGLDKIFSENFIESVIHFAGFKAVGKSVENPLDYYHNNISGTISLLKIMLKYSCKKIVFSSSATVYGDPESVPIVENFNLKPTNPYGRTKLMIEKLLEDIYISDNGFSIAILRYFNPVGAHSSGLIGEKPNDIPNNLMPYMVEVAKGNLEKLSVFGSDYPTKDGTGVRDYLHVVDLSDGHLKALNKIRKETGLKVYNLGTGNGYSVIEVIKAFEKANNIKIKYEITDRRPGDIAECYANSIKAKEELGWTAKKGIEEMCKDSWNFAIKNN